MKNKMQKSIEKIITIFLSIFIVTGLFLNYKLRDNVVINEEEKIFTDKEREYFSSVFEVPDRNSENVKNEYLKNLEEIKAKEDYDNKEEDIAKIYYYLGFNAYVDKDYEQTTKYLEYSMDKFEDIPNYFYKLNGNNILMNIAYMNGNYVEGINRANKIYEILQTPNIKGMSEQGQKGIKTNVLNGLIHISAKLGMTEMAKTYYDELVEITKENEMFEDNIAIYAKFAYNYTIGNYEEAKKYALKYIEYTKKIEPEDEEAINSSYTYLLDVAIELEDFKLAKEAFEKVLTTSVAKENMLIKGILEKLKGVAYEKLNKYDESFESYKNAIKCFEEIEDYENLTLVNDKIISLADNIKIDVEPYIQKLEEYKLSYNKDVIIGELADSLTKTAYKKNEEENVRTNEELERNSRLTSISKQINLVYLSIIILLAFMAKKLKSEITTRKSKEKELEKMVRTDYLTKAYSKQFIFDKTKEYILGKKNFTFIIFDLDNFKRVNDNYGHTFGDEILIEMIRTIKNTLGNNGYVGRFGGEEFVIVLKDGVDPNKFIESMRFDIANIEYSIKDFKATISGGAIRWNEQECDQLVYDADVLLYKAKAEGKDRILLR